MFDYIHRLLSSAFLQRSEIVTAAYEPTDEECEWKTDEEEELTVSKQVQVTYTCMLPVSSGVKSVKHDHLDTC